MVRVMTFSKLILIQNQNKQVEVLEKQIWGSKQLNFNDCNSPTMKGMRGTDAIQGLDRSLAITHQNSRHGGSSPLRPLKHFPKDSEIGQLHFEEDTTHLDASFPEYLLNSISRVRRSSEQETPAVYEKCVCTTPFVRCLNLWSEDWNSYSGNLGMKERGMLSKTLK